MKIETVGAQDKPVIIMLPGSFCPSEGLDYLYKKLEDNYHIILPEYNGHYENSTFTTRKNEAAEVVSYLKEKNITQIKMIYGQSMGAEIGIELYRQVLAQHMTVAHCFLDGAPCIKLSSLYKKVMYMKFKKMVGMMKGKSVEELLQSKLLKRISNGNTERLRPVLESFAKTVPFLTTESIKNETECCYTFDFPAMDEESQKKMYFIYGGNEKAYKSCYEGVKNAYPLATYKVMEGYGHLSYSIVNTDEYVKLLKTVCEE